MRLIGFRDWDWSNDGFYAGIPADAKPYVTIMPNILYRAGAPPAFGPSALGEVTIPCQFVYEGSAFDYLEDAWDHLLTRLNAYDTRSGELRAERNSGALVKRNAILTLPNVASFGTVADFKTLPVIFISNDLNWKAL